jgi:flagellar P-ring protein precursor FlgI
MALGRGPLVVEDDNPAGALVRSGGQMLRDLRSSPVVNGSITLVLHDEYAGFPMATTIAEAINGIDGLDDALGLDEYRRLATVEDAKNVRVRIPAAEQDRAAEFIAWLQTIPIDSSFINTRAPARIVINERAGIIAVTGNVELGPVGITHKDMQLTNITPPAPAPAPAPPAGAPAAPAETSSRWRGLDTTDRASRSSTRLVELLRAFDQLKVPVADQIAMIYELRRTGALHAEIVSQ